MAYDKFKICDVCGNGFRRAARSANHDTCDKVCTRAKRAKRTREEQIRHECAEIEYDDEIAKYKYEREKEDADDGW
jgi:hypothetical protein